MYNYSSLLNNLGFLTIDRDLCILNLFPTRQKNIFRPKSISDERFSEYSPR